MIAVNSKQDKPWHKPAWGIIAGFVGMAAVVIATMGLLSRDAALTTVAAVIAVPDAVACLVYLVCFRRAFISTPDFDKPVTQGMIRLVAVAVVICAIGLSFDFLALMFFFGF